MTVDPGRAVDALVPAAETVPVAVQVNGREHELRVEPRTLLSDLLRDRLGLTGTHVGCEHGVCGACTVEVDGDLVRSCLMLAVQVDGSRVRTIEGVSDGRELDPVQVALHEQHGLQCGFCTPALVLTLQRLIAELEEPSEQEIREYLSGNICRCTGYDGIVRAVRSALEAMR